MPCQVIPFPGAVSAPTTAEPILARHHIILEVGASRYEVDVLAFVKLLQSGQVQDRSGSVVWGGTGPLGTERRPPIGVEVVEWRETRRQGWRAVLRLRGSKQQWEAYWRQLGIADPAPAGGKEKEAQNSLALWREKSEESSCATGAAKETKMTNTDSHNTQSSEGAIGDSGAEKPARATRQGGRRKGSPAQRPQADHSGRGTRPRTGTKSAKKATLGAKQKSRAESKGAKILGLIRQAKGATLGTLMQATGWQAHSVRGFLSTAAKKQGLKITSSRNQAGQRVYKSER
jgi:Protein of unknown function (DUF3489)